MPEENTPKSTASRKALVAARSAAEKTVAKAVLFYLTHPNKRNWESIEAHLGIEIPSFYKSEDCNRKNITELWGQFYKDSTLKRVTEAFAAPKAEVISPVEAKAEVSKISEVTELYKFGEFTLEKDQMAVFTSITRDFFDKKKLKVALQDGKTGVGKMVIGCAVIDYILRNKLYETHGLSFYMHEIMIFMPKNVQEAWARHIERSGWGHEIGRKINIVPYSQLSATYGDALIQEEYDLYDPNKPPTLKWNPAMLPFFCLLDECHKVANENTIQTKGLMALTSAIKAALRPYSLWMSATPGVTVNNFKAFVCATGLHVPSLGINVNAQNWNMFAGLITNEPSKPNLEAAKRLRAMLSPHIYSLPYQRWKHKAINSVILLDFDNDNDRQTYQLAFERYKEKVELLGKGECKSPEFMQWVALGQFRKAVEPLRMPQIIRKCHEHIQSGKISPVIGCVYRDSVIRAVFGLVELGYRREDISIIWGGKREIKETLVLSPDEFKDLISRISKGYEPTKEDVKRLEETLAFKETRISYQEDSDEVTKQRLLRLREFGLTGSQNANTRQMEIDAFQSGKSKICIFTLAAGGIGLSLDHSADYLLPRVGYFTPTYSGPEFKQALGRLERRMTLSDTYQYIVGMVGTIEETHVMPLIDKKLQCIATLTNADKEIINFHKAKVVRLIRSIQEAVEDSDKDDARVENIEITPEDLEDENGD